MRTMLVRSVAATCLAGAALSAHADFSDNFDADTLGLNVTTFVGGWTVTSGSVDVVGDGYYDYLPGNGRYIDLDGTTRHGGTFVNSLALTGGVTYTASFQLAGSQRGDTNLVTVGFGGSSAVYTMLSPDPLTTYTLAFTPAVSGSYALSFANAGGDDFGAFLDNVRVAAAVPEPQTWALFGAGGLLLAARRLRRR